MTNPEIPFLRPSLVTSESYLHYLKQIEASRIYSNYGPLNSLFEQKVLKEYFSNQGAVTTVNNATTGLMLAISSNKRSGGKYALMPSFTFAATPLSAMWSGLIPHFIDIDENTWCMNEELVENAIQTLGDDLAVVVPYAAFGSWVDLDYYSSVEQRGIPVVVDAASSFGTNLDFQFGTGFNGAVVFSFHATKAFGIGEGGLVYSANKDLVTRVRQSTNFGFAEDRRSSLLGLNGKMSEYTAAIALATLEVFKDKIEVRNKVYNWYRDAIEKLELMEYGWKLQRTKGLIAHQYMPILCPEEKQNSEYVSKLAKRSIQIRHYFSPACHQQNMFLDCPHAGLPITEKVSTRVLSLPLWEEMDQDDVMHVIQELVR